MEATDYQVVHAIAGRIRCRLPALQTDQRLVDQLQHSLQSLAFVTEVRVNPAAQSIIISYRDQVISGADFEAGFAKLIRQLQSAPAAPVPLSNPSEQPQAERTEPEQPEIIESIESTPASTPQLAVEPPVANHTQAQEVKAIVSAELPSVWDDTTPSVQPKAPQPEAPKTTADLARRLGVSGQALNRRRSLSNFVNWSQIHDPQGLAWAYHPASKMYHPLTVPENLAEQRSPKSFPADSDQKTATMQPDHALTNGAGGDISKADIEQIQESLPLAEATELPQEQPKPPQGRSQKPTSNKGRQRSPRK